MKTHLLLSHLENDMHCPLCSLSGVSYDELCFHISSAHPEKQHNSQDLAHFTSSPSCSVSTNAGVTESERPQTSQSCSVGDSCTTAAGATPSTSSGVSTDSVRPKQNSTHKRGRSSPGEVAPITFMTCSLKENVRHCNDDSDKIQPDKAKHKQLSLPKKDELYFQTSFQNVKVCTDLSCLCYREAVLLPHVCTGL